LVSENNKKWNGMLCNATTSRDDISKLSEEKKFLMKTIE
jgi:hypothetical protein